MIFSIIELLSTLSFPLSLPPFLLINDLACKIWQKGKGNTTPKLEKNW